MQLRALLLLVTLALAAPHLRAETDTPDDALREELALLVEQQKELLLRLTGPAAAIQDDAELRSRLQQLAYAYEAFLKRHPKFVPAIVSYALLLNKVDMRKESIALFLRANQLDPNLPIVKNQLGNYLAEEGKTIEALQYYLSAIQLEPAEPLYHFQLGNLLAEARDDFLRSGQWTRPQLDQTMLNAFEQAMKHAPDDWRYAYRYGLCYYDLEKPDWAAALKFWQDFEPKLNPGLEQQTCRLHQAKILLEQHRPDDARALLATVTEQGLAAQKQKLIAQLDPSDKK